MFNTEREDSSRDVDICGYEVVPSRASWRPQPLFYRKVGEGTVEGVCGSSGRSIIKHSFV